MSCTEREGEKRDFYDSWIFFVAFTHLIIISNYL